MPRRPEVTLNDLSAALIVRKANLFKCRIWKDSENYCKACRHTKKCLESEKLADEKQRAQDPTVRSMEEVRKHLLIKKAKWLANRKAYYPNSQYVEELAAVRREIDSISDGLFPPLPSPLPPPFSKKEEKKRMKRIPSPPSISLQSPPCTPAPPSPALSIAPLSSPTPISPIQPPSPTDSPSSSLPLSPPISTCIPPSTSPSSPPPVTPKKKMTADEIIMDQDLPRLTKRTKGLNLEPLQKPAYKDFAASLQNREPHQFKVMKSQAEDAGYGLYFNGTAYAGELLTGYGGERKEITKGAHSHYSARIGISKYAIDATRLSQYSKRGNYDSTKYPLGHMVNRPPTGGRSNCKFSVKGGVLFVAARRGINTHGEWLELYVPYNDNRV